MKRLKNVRIAELSGVSWIDGDEKRAPTVISMINHHNRISAWTVSEIVSEMNLEVRIMRLKFFVMVASVIKKRGKKFMLLGNVWVS